MSERDDLFELWSRHGSSFESDSSEGYELADAILNSPWLAAHDEQVRREERKNALQDVREAIASLPSTPWFKIDALAAIDAIRAVSEQEEHHG